MLHHHRKAITTVFSVAIVSSGCANDADLPEDQQGSTTDQPSAETPRAGLTASYTNGEMAIADFDGDGNDDIVIGNPTKNGGFGCPSKGEIQIWYNQGSLWYNVAPDASWNRDTAAVEGSSSCWDWFGASLAAGDFNGDGYDDLAVGVPGDDPDETNSGSIHVFYGSSTGLSTANDVIYDQDDLAGTTGASEYFGEFLTSADFNCDGDDDLAIGVPHEGGTATTGGAVVVVYGGSTGLVRTSAELWDQDSSGVPDTVESGDECGAAVVAGNFNGDTSSSIECMDLAWGCPGEDVGSLSNAGSITVLYGSTSGLTGSGSDHWTQDTTGIVDTSSPNEEFGFYLGTDDTNTDGYDDIIVVVDDGCTTGNDLHTILGSSGGLTDADDAIECIDDSASSITYGPCCDNSCECKCTGPDCFSWIADNTSCTSDLSTGTHTCTFTCPGPDDPDC